MYAYISVIRSNPITKKLHSEILDLKTRSTRFNPKDLKGQVYIEHLGRRLHGATV